MNELGIWMAFIAGLVSFLSKLAGALIVIFGLHMMGCFSSLTPWGWASHSS